VNLALGGAVLAAGALLCGGGVAKVARPDDTARAVRVSPALVRAGAAAEVVVGLGALTGWSVFVLALALSYLGLAAFVAVALARGWSLASCGCFGEPDSPPTVLHVLIDGAAALAALAAFVAGGAGPLRMIADQPGRGLVMAGLSLVIGGLAYLCLSRLPALRAAA
jgi:hypothetical protein